jgi:hypothetical protein
VATGQNALQVIYSPRFGPKGNPGDSGLHTLVHNHWHLMLKTLSFSELSVAIYKNQRSPVDKSLILFEKRWDSTDDK